MKTFNNSLMFFDIDVLDLVSYYNSSRDDLAQNTSALFTMLTSDDSDDVYKVVYMLHNFGHFRAFFVPVNTMIGLFGNLLTVLSITNTSLRLQPTLHFVVAKCVADSLFLSSVAVQWLQTLGVPVFGDGISCNVLTMISQASNFLATWFVVCLSVDRFIIVIMAGSQRPPVSCLPNSECMPKIRFKPSGQMSIVGWTVMRALMAIISLSLLSVAIYLNTSLVVGATARGHGIICVPLPRFMHAVRILGRIDVFINVLLPQVIIVALTLTTCWRVFRFHSARRKAITKREFSRQNYQFYSKTQLRLTVMSAAVCGYYIICTLPSHALRLQYTIGELLYTQRLLTIHEYFWQHVFLIIYFSAFSLNFPVILAVHKGFRKAVELLFLESYYKVRGWYRRRRNGDVPLSPMEFAFGYSSTLVHLQETTLN